MPFVSCDFVHMLSFIHVSAEADPTMLNARHEAEPLIISFLNETPMNRIVHNIGLNVHQESIRLCRTPQEMHL